MKITIEIPEEFNGDFQKDRFKEFFDRVIADIDMEGLCGNYEAETAEMLKNSFQNAKIYEEYIAMKKVSEMAVQEIIDLVENELRKQGVLELWSRGANVFVDNKNIGGVLGVIMPNDSDIFNHRELEDILEDYDNNYHISFRNKNEDTRRLMNNTTEPYRILMWTAKDGWLRF